MGLLVDIRKNYGAFRLDVDFFAQGGVTGLLGASGCGKSVTLKCIAGIETPDEGRIELDGRMLFDSRQNINLSPQQRHIGYLFQSYALFPNMTVAQNIASGVRDRRHRTEETARLMASFQLEESAHKYPRQISGGQQQRVALARILASQPEALLLDEPFSALDVYLKWQVELELAERLSQFPGQVLFVTHDQNEIRHQCQGVCVLNRGKSQAVQTVDELFDSPATLSACRLSGCQNLSRVRPLGDGQVESPDWGAVLALAAPPIPGLSYVGVHAHQIRLCDQPGPNRIPCRLLRATPGAGSLTSLLLSTSGGTQASSLLRVETAQASPTSGAPLWAELPPDALLQLTDA